MDGWCCRPHRFSGIDKHFMKELAPLVNIIPIIAKADSMTGAELIEFKKSVKKDLEDEGIEWYEFATREQDLIREEERRVCELLASDATLLAECPQITDVSSAMQSYKLQEPFAVIASDNHDTGQDVRTYPFGTAKGTNPLHSDFPSLCQLMINRAPEDLRHAAFAKFQAWTQTLKQEAEDAKARQLEETARQEQEARRILEEQSRREEEDEPQPPKSMRFALLVCMILVCIAGGFMHLWDAPAEDRLSLSLPIETSHQLQGSSPTRPSTVQLGFNGTSAVALLHDVHKARAHLAGLAINSSHWCMPALTSQGSWCIALRPFGWHSHQTSPSDQLAAFNATLWHLPTELVHLWDQMQFDVSSTVLHNVAQISEEQQGKQFGPQLEALSLLMMTEAAGRISRLANRSALQALLHP